MKQLERFYPWLLVAPAILPVVVWGGFVYPYLVLKTLLFYAISLLAVGVFAILVAHGRAFYWSRLKRWEAWVPGVLLLIAYATSAVGLDFYRSFWSLFVRGDGLLMLTGAVASYYLVLLSADAKFFERLLRAVAAVGSFVAVYGIGEWMLGGGRIGGLLGNAAFFAGYLALAFFATLLAAQSLSKGWKRAAYGGAFLQVIAILLSATRGTILALALAGLAYIGYRGFLRPEPADVSTGVRLGRAARSAPVGASAGVGRMTFRISLMVIVIIAGSFFAFRTELTKIPFAPVARIASISASDPDIANRLFVWRGMLTEIKKSPWLGVGAEHIDVLFNRFYDPTQISEQWFDRSHNAFLDYSAQYGIGGLLLYLALIGGFLSAAARFARRGERGTGLIVALLGMTYAIQNFFVFDTISSFWLMLALLAGVAALSREVPEVEPRESLAFPPLTRYASFIFALLFALCIIPVSIQPALAAYDLASAYKYQLTDPAREVSDLSHGMALATYGDLEYGYTAYDMYATHQATGAYALVGAARTDAYQAALSILTSDFNQFPYDARTALYLAHVLALAPIGVSVDENLLSSALTRAITLSAKRSQPWYILANVSISNANANPVGSPGRATGYAAAHDILSKYIALVPKLSEPHFVLAQLEYAAGDTASAASEAALGKKFYQSDLETASRAAVYYETVLDLPSATFFLGEVIKLDPSNTAAKGDLEKIKAYEQSAK